jgi:hypothetical protein
MSESAKPLRKIFMYKMIQGNKVRWQFEVDSEMIIVSEGPAENQTPAAAAVAPGPKPVAMQPDAMDKYKKVLEERGIKYSMTANGQIVVNEIPTQEKMIMQFFDLNTPCPEGLGWEDIRTKYKYEYDQAGGSACPACQLNTLQRKYREILKARLPHVTT